MNMSNQEIAIVQTTVPSAKEARSLSTLILKKRIGACVQILRLKSRYRWRGKIESANELLVSIKTGKGNAARLIAVIKKHHPYELPEIITLNAKAGHDYANWVARETKRLQRSSRGKR